MKNDNKKQNTDLVNSVLSRLEKERVEPRSRFYWLGHEVLIWSLWVLSVIFGALSVAVLSFASLNATYALYEATHESFLTFIIEVLPFVWFGLFAVMVWLAYFNLRHTKKGYKYPFWAVVSSSLVFSTIFGLLLNVGGVGYYLDTYVGRALPVYNSQKEIDQAMWQSPEGGRFIGILEPGQNSFGTTSLVFRDIEDKEWLFDTEELKERDLKTLERGEEVKVIGVVVKEETADGLVEILHACNVMPWLLKKPPMIGELREERQEFLEKLVDYRQRALGQSDVDIISDGDHHTEVIDTKDSVKDSLCAEVRMDRTIVLPPEHKKMEKHDDDSREDEFENEENQERESEFEHEDDEREDEEDDD